MDVISGHLLNIFGRMSEAMIAIDVCPRSAPSSVHGARRSGSAGAALVLGAHIRSSNIAMEFAMIRLATYGRRHRSTV